MWSQANVVELDQQSVGYVGRHPVLKQEIWESDIDWVSAVVTKIEHDKFDIKVVAERSVIECSSDRRQWRVCALQESVKLWQSN
jgi:hypothetical protein